MRVSRGPGHNRQRVVAPRYTGSWMNLSDMGLPWNNGNPVGVEAQFNASPAHHAFNFNQNNMNGGPGSKKHARNMLAFTTMQPVRPMAHQRQQLPDWHQMDTFMENGKQVFRNTPASYANNYSSADEGRPSLVIWHFFEAKRNN